MKRKKEVLNKLEANMGAVPEEQKNNQAFAIQLMPKDLAYAEKAGIQ